MFSKALCYFTYRFDVVTLDLWTFLDELYATQVSLSKNS